MESETTPTILITKPVPNSASIEQNEFKQDAKWLRRERFRKVMAEMSITFGHYLTAVLTNDRICESQVLTPIVRGRTTTSDENQCASGARICRKYPGSEI